MTTKETFKNKEDYEIYEDEKGNASGYWYNDDGISVGSKKYKYILKLENNTVIKQLIP